MGPSLRLDRMLFLPQSCMRIRMTRLLLYAPICLLIMHPLTRQAFAMPELQSSESSETKPGLKAGWKAISQRLRNPQHVNFHRIIGPSPVLPPAGGRSIVGDARKPEYPLNPEPAQHSECRRVTETCIERPLRWQYLLEGPVLVPKKEHCCDGLACVLEKATRLTSASPVMRSLEPVWTILSSAMRGNLHILYSRFATTQRVQTITKTATGIICTTSRTPRTKLQERGLAVDMPVPLRK